jgi:ABC-2 type transport system permease protein
VRALGPYWQVARRSFRRYSTYRGATFAGVFTNTVFGFLKAYVLLAVFRLRHNVGNFDATDVLTFTFVAQGFLATVGAFGELELSDRIRTGDVVSDLYRPLHFQGYWLSAEFGRAAFQAIFRGIPPFLVGALVFHLRLPEGVWGWVGFVVSLALAIVLSFAYRFLTSLSGFWLLDTRGPAQIASFVMQFMSGFIIPLTFLPNRLYHIAVLLPFAGVAQLPVEIFLGKHRSVSSTVSVLGIQVFWIAVLIGTGEVVVRRALRKVVVQGG